jgi:hypothetical protein
MPTRDLHNSVHALPGIAPQKQTNADTAFVSAILDTAMYESAEFLILTGTSTDANVTFTVLVEDGDVSNLSDNVAVNDNFLLGTEVAAAFRYDDDVEVRKIGYVGSKRYVRVTITPSGNNSGDILIAGVWLQGHPRRKPTPTLADD